MNRRRRLLLYGVLGVLLLLALDVFRAPERQLTAKALLAAIDLYQATLSPVLGAAGARCRFTPTCSRYGEAAIRQDGALIGTLRTIHRIGRCGPWTPAGTYDPP